MALHQGVAHGEVLGQADQGVVDRAVPVGVVPAQHVATQVADFLKGLSLVRLSSYMAYKIRRCTGFNPSRTSGRARLLMTDMAYSI